jgi:thioredoxin-like negative regulator of GroEL
MTRTVVADISTRLAWDMDIVGDDHLSVVLFYSPSCSPSMRMIDTFAQLAAIYQDARFFTVNTNNNPEIVWQFRVSIVPTIMVFQRGQKLHEMITYKTSEEVQFAIMPFLQPQFI